MVESKKRNEVTEMKKRALLVMLSIVAAVGLSGCGKKAEPETEKVTEAVTETEAAAETEEVVETETAVETEEVTETEESTEAVTETEIDLAAMAAAGPFGVFVTQTLDGETATQEIFKEADLTMVNIWGTFCSPCINEMPDLGELAREYEEKGVQLIGMISDVVEAKDETATLIVEETGADYTHLILSESLYYSLSQIQVVPTTVFIDREGKQVGYTYTGSRSKEEWSAIVDEMLLEVQ